MLKMMLMSLLCHTIFMNSKTGFVKAVDFTGKSILRNS
jgi:hypothetical protein